MTENENAPAIEQGAQSNLSKDTNFMGNTQLLDATLKVRQEIAMCNSELEQRKKEQYKGKSCQTILNELLNQIHSVNFREIAG